MKEQQQRMAFSGRASLGKMKSPRGAIDQKEKVMPLLNKTNDNRRPSTGLQNQQYSNIDYTRSSQFKDISSNSQLMLSMVGKNPVQEEEAASFSSGEDVYKQGVTPSAKTAQRVGGVNNSQIPTQQKNFISSKYFTE